MKERKRFSALETSTQIMMATLDQEFHSKAVISPTAESSKTGRFDSEKVLRKVQSEFNVIPHVEGTNFTPTFGHLFGYGATYYSYLFDRAIASEIFQQKFAKDALSRERGEEFKKGVLQWGGGKDSWEMIGGLIGDEEIMRGGKKAMEIVGKWGIKEE